MRQALEPILFEAGVDIMFAGWATPLLCYAPPPCVPPSLQRAWHAGLRLSSSALSMQTAVFMSIVWCGICRHVHAYERCNRVYNYNVDPCGPISITVGDGGNHASSTCMPFMMPRCELTHCCCSARRQH